MAREITLTTGPDLWPQPADATNEAVEITALEGDDTITGTQFDDLILGNQGDDQIDVGAGDDIAYGGQGNDTLNGLLGNNLLLGNQGDDDIILGSGNNTVFGGQGSDFIQAGTGGNNIIFGNLGDDILISGADGNNYLHGGQGNDIIEAATGEGSDTLIGGAGDDTFVFPAGTAPANSVYGNLETGGTDSGIDTILVTGDNNFTTTNFNDIQKIEVESGATATFTLASLAGVTTLGGEGTIQLTSTTEAIQDYLLTLGQGVGDNITFTDVDGNPVQFPPIATSATLTVNIDDVSVAGVISAPLAAADTNVFTVPTLQSGDRVVGLGEEDILNARIGSNTLIANIPPILAQITDVETINLAAERLNDQGFSSNPFLINASQITGTDRFAASSNTGVVRVAGIRENAEVILTNSTAGFQTTFASNVSGEATIRFQNAQLPNDYISVEPESGSGFNTFNIYSETSAFAETVTNRVGHVISKTVEANGSRGPLVNGGTSLRTVNITGVQNLNLTGNVSPAVASLPGEVTTINANGLRDASGDLVLDAEGNVAFPIFEGDLRIGRAPNNDIFFSGGSGDDFINFDKTLNQNDRIEGGDGNDTVRATFEKTVVADGIEITGNIIGIPTDVDKLILGFEDVKINYFGLADVEPKRDLPVFLDPTTNTLFLKTERMVGGETTVDVLTDVFIEGVPRPIDDFAIRNLSGQEYAFDKFNFSNSSTTARAEFSNGREVVSISQGQANPSLIPGVILFPLPQITIGGEERSIPLFIVEDNTGAEAYYSWLVEPGTRNALDANGVSIDPNQPTDRQPGLFRVNPNNFIEFPDGIGNPIGIGNVNGGSFGPSLGSDGNPILALDDLDFDLNFLNTQFGDTVTETGFDGDGNPIVVERSTLYTRLLQAEVGGVANLGDLVSVTPQFGEFDGMGSPPLFSTTGISQINRVPEIITVSVNVPDFGGFSATSTQITTIEGNEPTSTLKLNNVENLELTVNVIVENPTVTFDQVQFVLASPTQEFIDFKNEFIEGVGPQIFNTALANGSLLAGISAEAALTLPMNDVFGLETITFKPTLTGGVAEITGLTALPTLITFEGDGSVGSQVVNGLSINGTPQDNILNLLYENGGTQKNGSYEAGLIKTGTIATINLTVEDADLNLRSIEGNNALRSINFIASGDVTVDGGIDTASTLDSGDVITSIDASQVEGKFVSFSESLARNATVTLGKDDSEFDASGSALPGTGAFPDNGFGSRPGVTIIAQGGDDQITGTALNDIIEGAGGSDNLTGNSGSDTFVYRNFSDSLLNSTDVITDFLVGTAATGNVSGDQFGDVIRVPLQIDNKAEVFLLQSPTALTASAINTIYTASNAQSSATNQFSVFPVNSIGVFEFNDRSFVTFNSGTSGFQSAFDSIIELDGPSTSITQDIFNTLSTPNNQIEVFV